MKNSKTSENFTRALEIIAEVQQHEDKFDAVYFLLHLAARSPGDLVAVYDKGTKEASFQSRLLEILRNGKKVEAIKLYREEKGGGLQEGKIAVEEIIKKHGLPLPPVVPPRTC